ANEIQQQTTTIDPAMGTLETVQTNQYVVAGSGPVCVNVTDTNKQFYNYQGDQNYTGPFSPYPVLSSTPLVVTTVTETLALQSASVSAQARTAQSSGLRIAIPPVAVSLARQNVQHLMMHAVAQRRVAGSHRLSLAHMNGAQRK